MSIWKVEIFDNAGDESPSKCGYVEADTEGEAGDIVINAAGFPPGIVNLDRAVKELINFPSGIVLWEVL